VYLQKPMKVNIIGYSNLVNSCV